MNALVQNGIDQSKLEVSLIRINQQEPDTFMIEIEARITNIGPIGATMKTMPVDLIGPQGAFGKLVLPNIKLQPSGTDIHITPQKIDIADHDAFQAFVKSIQLDAQTSLELLNPAAQVSAMFMSTTAHFHKTVYMSGMNGPQIKLVKTVSQGSNDGAFINTIKISNPSPLEIFIPQSVFQYVDEIGTVVAEQYGEFNIPRGESSHDLPGRITAGLAQGQISLKGLDVRKESWMKTTIKYFDSKISLTPVLAGMITL